jgi:hypothetical protein
MSAEYLQWFDVTFSDGRNVRIAAHEPVEIENGLENGCLDNLLDLQEPTAKVTIRQIHCATQESRLFTVFGVYSDNGYQRFGFMAGAQSPEEAEQMVEDYATYFCWGDPIIACVLEGEQRAVDTDPAFGMRDKWQAAA